MVDVDDLNQQTPNHPGVCLQVDRGCFSVPGQLIMLCARCLLQIPLDGADADSGHRMVVRSSAAFLQLPRGATSSTISSWRAGRAEKTKPSSKFLGSQSHGLLHKSQVFPSDKVGLIWSDARRSLRIIDLSPARRCAGIRFSAAVGTTFVGRCRKLTSSGAYRDRLR